MSSNDHTLEGGEGGELEAWRSLYEEERQRTAQMEKRMTVLESKLEQHEKRGAQPGSEGKEYRVTRGSSGLLCPTIDFPNSGCCKAAMVGQRWKTLLGLHGHLDKVMVPKKIYKNVKKNQNCCCISVVFLGT